MFSGVKKRGPENREYLDYLLDQNHPWYGLAKALYDLRSSRNFRNLEDFHKTGAVTTLGFPGGHTPRVASFSLPPLPSSASGVPDTSNHAERVAERKASSLIPPPHTSQSARFFIERHPCDYRNKKPGEGCLPWMESTFPGGFEGISLTPQYATNDITKQFLFDSFNRAFRHFNPSVLPSPASASSGGGGSSASSALVPSSASASAAAATASPAYGGGGGRGGIETFFPRLESEDDDETFQAYRLASRQAASRQSAQQAGIQATLAALRASRATTIPPHPSYGAPPDVAPPVHYGPHLAPPMFPGTLAAHPSVHPHPHGAPSPHAHHTAVPPTPHEDTAPTPDSPVIDRYRLDQGWDWGYPPGGFAKGGHISLRDAVELLGPYLKHKKLAISINHKRALHASNYL